MSKFNQFGKNVLNGLAAVGTALADSTAKTRIREIDAQIKELQQERDHLIAGLIEPGNLKVSDSYDPYWRKREVEEDEPDTPLEDAGRLTQCKGRWSAASQFHDAHPGCPYLDTKHNPHEFTLRD